MMTETMISQWQMTRSAFNHDWLKNRYLNNLGGFIALLESENPDMDHLEEFLALDFIQWEEKSQKVEWLIRSFETEMSPATLFNYEPLKRMEKHCHAWLKKWVHALWLSRYSLREKIDRVNRLFSNTWDHYRKIDNKLKIIDKTAANLKQMLPEFSAFRETCLSFSKSLSQLLSEVLVV
jgi:hypothetical protein